MWTPLELACKAQPWSGEVWCVVESQSHVATLKLVDTLDEQAILEAELEKSKPAYPSACDGLDYLLATPFRYAPYKRGSRFRRAHQRDGCFYASERIETAIAETAFYQLLFFLDSPDAKRPANPQERTAFSVPVSAATSIDLDRQPLDQDALLWEHPLDYGPCQDLADMARQARIEVIRYRSVRDPDRGLNVAILSPAALNAKKPEKVQTWRIFIRDTSVQAVREMPRLPIEFPFSYWSSDSRVPESLSTRSSKSRLLHPPHPNDRTDPSRSPTQ